MAQSTVVSGYATNVAAAFRTVGFGVLIAWQRQYASNVNFFTIGTSLIGGGDIIKGGGSFVTFFDKYQFGDYSQYVMSWTVTRAIGQYPYGMIMAQADVELDNTSKIFLPNFDATIGSGILPNRPIKISASIGQESLMQFSGFTGMPELSVTGRTLSLHAFDVMDQIQKYSFTTSGTTTSGLAGTTTSGYLVSNRTDQAIAYYLGQLGFSSNQYVLDQGLSAPIGYLPVADRKLGDVLADLVQLEQGLLFADETGIIRFWNRQHFNTTSGTVGFRLTYDNMSDLAYQATPIINDVIVRASPRVVQAKQKIWEQTIAKEILPGQTVVIIADFVDDFGVIPTTSVDTPAPISSAITSAYTANLASDGTGTDMTATLSLLGVYNFGKSYKMTFRNSTSNSIFITNLRLYGTPAKVTSQIEQRYLDQVSIDAYGRNPANNGEPIIVQNDYIQDNGTAYSLAYTLVNDYKNPRRRYKVSIFTRPEIQIGDYGTVTVLDTAETKNMWVVGNTISMGRNADFRQDLELEERSITNYFTIGTSTIAGLDSIAP